MDSDNDRAILRARDFWGALVLMSLSLFFLWRTGDIPLFGGNRAGVRSADWYNSAAIVPLGIFSALLVLSTVMMTVAIRAGGAKTALTRLGIGWNRLEAIRFATLAMIMFFYIAGLVPRVDFILASGLLITALTFGYHGGYAARMILAAVAMALCGTYALAANLPQSEWGAWDDDSLTACVWTALTIWVGLNSRGDKVLRAVPIIAVVAPTMLVCAMAFGFRQNVPNRGGILFKQIEYHYYVTLKPVWGN